MIDLRPSPDRPVSPRRASAGFVLLTAFLAVSCAQDNSIQNRISLRPRDIDQEHPLYIASLFVKGTVDPSGHNPRLDPAQPLMDGVDTDDPELAELYAELLADRIADTGLFRTIDIVPVERYQGTSVWKMGTYLNVQTYWTLAGGAGAQAVSMVSLGRLTRQPIGKVIWQGLVRTKTTATAPDQELRVLLREAASSHCSRIVEALLRAE